MRTLELIRLANYFETVTAQTAQQNALEDHPAAIKEYPRAERISEHDRKIVNELEKARKIVQDGFINRKPNPELEKALKELDQVFNKLLFVAK